MHRRSGKVSVLRCGSERERRREKEIGTGRNGAELKAPYDTQKDKDRGVGITSKSFFAPRVSGIVARVNGASKSPSIRHYGDKERERIYFCKCATRVFY